MREGFDKEIDLLLRRRARGGAQVRDDARGARAPDAAAHLDADELGAFAEGALPAAARVAAVAHLADCHECRSVVVGLARASGVEAELNKHAAAVPASTEAAKPAAWRAWMASLFAPRVLRYAAPVLALCVVAVVSFVALRSRQGSEKGSTQTAMREIRRTEASKDQAGGGLATTETANANANVEGLVDQKTDNAPRSSTAANTSAQPSVGRGHGAGEAPPALADAKTEDAVAPPPPPAGKPEGPDETAGAASRPVSTEEGELAKRENKEKTARKDESVDEVASNDQPSQQKRAAQSRGLEPQAPDGSRNQTRSSVNNTSNAAASGGGDVAAAAPKAADRDSVAKSASASRRGRAAAIGGQRLEDDEVTRADEIRSAAGHRFRREGGAWVDVNYKTSMPSTGVRRGTEAYRALTADIPEVGRVAEQIGGEVVVVVHGHAYRVR
jgi:hypothetical protein